MISFNRIAAVFKKDFTWAMGNLKLLGIMIMPVFIVVLFSKLDGDSTFAFTILFVNAFVGLFTTSYLIIEEKNKGTLMALLTSPLKSSELLISKFSFTVFICLLFSLFAVFLNHRFEVITNPLFLFNLILYSGLTCFSGYTVGLFLKNEQELGVISPILMMFFILGGTIGLANTGIDLAPFFPEYHLSQLLSATGKLNFTTTLTHTLFNLLYFSTSMLFAVLYTKFYFSNSSEKRFSAKLFIPFILLISSFFISGFLSPKFVKNKATEATEGLVTYDFNNTHWSGFFNYDPSDFKVKQLFESKHKRVIRATYLPNDNKTEVILSIRVAKAKENTAELREETLRSDNKRHILGLDKVDLNNIEFKKWTYINQNKIIILTEAHCGPSLLQVSTEITEASTKTILEGSQILDTFTKELKPECKESI